MNNQSASSDQALTESATSETMLALDLTNNVNLLKVRNSMSFSAPNLNNYFCRYCKDNHLSFQNLQTHYENVHPVKKDGQNYLQLKNDQDEWFNFATTNSDVCIWKNCPYNKFTKRNNLKDKNIFPLRFKMQWGGDYSNFNGWLPFPEEFDHPKGLYLCCSNTIEAMQYGEETVSEFIKIYGIMATLTPHEMPEPQEGTALLIILKRCPFPKRVRKPKIDTKSLKTDSSLILSKLDEHTFKLDLQSIKLDHLQNPPVIENYPVSVAEELQTFFASRNYFEIVVQNNTFSAKKEVDNTITTISGHISQTFTCPICKEVFQEKEQLAQHRTSNHLAESGWRSETKSSSSLSSTDTIVTELNQFDISEQEVYSQSSDSFKCKSCHKRFKLKHHLLKHTLQNHQNKLNLNEPPKKQSKVRRKQKSQFQEPPKKRGKKQQKSVEIENNVFVCEYCTFSSIDPLESYNHYILPH